MNQAKEFNMYPRVLWFLLVSYVMVLVLSNWFDARLIHVFGLNTDAGTLIFPFSFLLADLITEVYGYKHTRRAIWVGFLFNLFFVLYGQLIIHLPSPDYATNNYMFNQVLAISGRVIAASLISYLCSEPLNAFILAKLKIKTKGKLIWLRFVASTFIASGFDSFIFGFIAFFGMMGNRNLLALIITMWFIKVCIEVIGLPFSIFLARKLKAVEGVDVYDTKTDFTLFSFDVGYKQEANHFKAQQLS
jgi:queuosine precursor transporter